MQKYPQPYFYPNTQPYSYAQNYGQQSGNNGNNGNNAFYAQQQQQQQQPGMPSQQTQGQMPNQTQQPGGPMIQAQQPQSQQQMQSQQHPQQHMNPQQQQHLQQMNPQQQQYMHQHNQQSVIQHQVPLQQQNPQIHPQQMQQGHPNQPHPSHPSHPSHSSHSSHPPHSSHPSHQTHQSNPPHPQQMPPHAQQLPHTQMQQVQHAQIQQGPHSHLQSQHPQHPQMQSQLQPQHSQMQNQILPQHGHMQPQLQQLQQMQHSQPNGIPQHLLPTNHGNTMMQPQHNLQQSQSMPQTQSNMLGPQGFMQQQHTPPNHVTHSSNGPLSQHPQIMPHSITPVPPASTTVVPVPVNDNPLVTQLNALNESCWQTLGNLANMMGSGKALSAYEAALKVNPYSVVALAGLAAIYKEKEQFPKAVEYYSKSLQIDPNNGQVWREIGHCHLMLDDMQKAYAAYQQALYHLPNPKDSKLWYGIGILYDRYGSYEHAEEAFSAVLRMDTKFEKSNEIYFRLGIIQKHLGKYDQSLECLRYILTNPPKPLVDADVWFQIGHVCELKKDIPAAKDAYGRVIKENPQHAKVLQQLGWLYHQPAGPGQAPNQELAIQYLTMSKESDPNDAQTYYLLGRCFMGQQKYNQAYEMYQQAVYRDARNPTFWCSIGVLYYQISQYRDALDAYTRAIRLNPYIPEVWYDLGALYESCNNQLSDAIDAYARAAELDPSNNSVKARLMWLRTQHANGARSISGTDGPPAPVPQDVNPTTYQAMSRPLNSFPPAANSTSPKNVDMAAKPNGAPLTELIPSHKRPLDTNNDDPEDKKRKLAMISEGGNEDGYSSSPPLGVPPHGQDTLRPFAGPMTTERPINGPVHGESDITPSEKDISDNNDTEVNTRRNSEAQSLTQDVKSEAADE